MGDLEFVQRCASGDKLAWDQFIEKYSRLIYSSLYSALRLKGRNLTQETVNELFQEIILSLIQNNFKKLKTFRAKNGCTLVGWLRQVAINHAIDYLRKHGGPVSLDAEDHEGNSLKDVIPSAQAGAPEVVMQKERMRQLTKCIKALERQEKYFLELHFNRGLDFETLMKHLQLSRAAVDMRKSRIIARLRECFKRKGFVLDF